jgi:hypothetical protein
LIGINNCILTISPKDVDIRRVLVQSSLHGTSSNNPDLANRGEHVSIRAQRDYSTLNKSFGAHPIDAATSTFGGKFYPESRAHVTEIHAFEMYLRASQPQKSKMLEETYIGVNVHFLIIPHAGIGAEGTHSGAKRVDGVFSENQIVRCDICLCRGPRTSDDVMGQCFTILSVSVVRKQRISLLGHYFRGGGELREVAPVLCHYFNLSNILSQH